MAKFSFKLNGNGKYSGDISGLGGLSGGGGEKDFSKMTTKEIFAESFKEFKESNYNVKAGMGAFAKNLKAGGKNIAGVIGDAVGGIAKAGMETVLEMEQLDAEVRKAEIALEQTNNSFANKMQKIDFETAFKNQLAYVDTYMKNAVNLTSASFKAITDGLQSGAWASYNAMMDAEKNVKMLDIDMQYNITKQRMERANTVKEYELEYTQKQNDIRKKEIDVEMAYTRKLAEGGRMIGNAVSFAGPWGAVIGAIISAASTIAEGERELSLGTEKINMDLQEANMAKNLKNFQEKMENYGIVIDNETELKRKYLDFQFELIKLYGEQAQKVEDMVHKFNEIATKSASLYGYVGGQLEKMKKNDLTKGIVAWATKYHMNPEEMIQAQLGYQNETGRNIHVSELDVARTNFLDLYAGQKGITGKISSQLQVFNKSISESAKIVSTRMASLERSGLSSKKYAQDVEKYIGLANKYNFRGGVDGLMRMMEYAQKTKFNMDSIGGVIDKFSTTDISSVLETSAKLNVLGGNAALYSDPIAMRYEAINDPDALIRRMQAMTSGYGTFDTSRGEMRYDEVGTMIMKTMADLLGISVEDMRKMDNETYKRNEISSIKSGSDLNNDQLDFLINNSFWSKEKGGWVTSMLGGGEELVANIDSSKIENIIPTVTEDKMSMMVRNVDTIREKIDKFLSKSEEEERVRKEQELRVVEEYYVFMMTQFNERIDAADKAAEVFFNENEAAIKLASKQATQSMQNVADAAKTAIDKVNSAEVDGPINQIKNDVEALRKGLISEDVFRYGKTIGQLISERDNLMLMENKTPDQGLRLNEVIGMINDWTMTELYGGESIYENGKIKSLDAITSEKDGTVTSEKDGTEGTSTDFLESVYHTTKAQDAFTSGQMYSPSANVITSSEDVNMSWKKGGQLDTLFNGVAGKVNVIGDFIEQTTGGKSGVSSTNDRNVNVTVSFGGSAELLCNGTRTDIGETLMNDPFFTRKLTEEILKEISKMFDGRGVWNSYVNLKNIFK